MNASELKKIAEWLKSSNDDLLSCPQ